MEQPWREIVGDDGAVTTIKIEPRTYNFAKKNLLALGYHDILSILGDGSEGYSPGAPYDKICVTAASPKVPSPLIQQLRIRGKIAAPIGHPRSPQNLTIMEKRRHSIPRSSIIEQVLYVPLFGRYGWSVKERSDSA